MVERLIAHGAKPRDNQLKTAAWLGELKMVKQLLQADADPNDSPENPPIVSAAYRGYNRVVEHLLTHPDIEVDKQDIDRLNAL